VFSPFSFHVSLTFDPTIEQWQRMTHGLAPLNFIMCIKKRWLGSSSSDKKAKGKRRAGPEEDLRVSELPKALQEASDLALSVLAKDSTGEHNPHSHQWSELRYKVRSRMLTILSY
jgi:hypothetical protein